MKKDVAESLGSLAQCADIGGTSVSGDDLLHFAARGWLTVGTHEQLAVINYDSTALSNVEPTVARQIVQFRGMVVDCCRAATPVVPSSTPFRDLGRFDSYDAKGTVRVSEKVDGVLIALFHDGRRWRASSRDSLTNQAVVLAEEMAPSLHGLSQDLVLYFELQHPGLGTVIPSCDSNLFLVDAKLRAAHHRDGWASLAYDELALIARQHNFRLPRGIPWPGSASLLWDLIERSTKLVEGFVLADDSGMRTRLVSPLYAALYDLAVNPTPATVCELYRDGWDLNRLTSLVRHIVGNCVDPIVRDLEEARSILERRMAIGDARILAANLVEASTRSRSRFVR